MPGHSGAGGQRPSQGFEESRGHPICNDQRAPIPLQVIYIIRNLPSGCAPEDKTQPVGPGTGSFLPPEMLPGRVPLLSAANNLSSTEKSFQTRLRGKKPTMTKEKSSALVCGRESESSWE